MKIRIIKFFTLLLLLITAPLAVAENSTHIDGFTIHHNAIPSALLTPEVASSYKITRSKYRGLINISVIKDIPGTTGKPVTAKVTASSLDPIGRQENIDLREIKEGQAIYYIGEFPIVDGETLKFTLEVTPEGTGQTAHINMSQDFYVD